MQEKDGLNWLVFLNKYGLHGILADDLGLGKTLQTLCLLDLHHHHIKSSCGSISKMKESCETTLDAPSSSIKVVKEEADYDSHTLHSRDLLKCQTFSGSSTNSALYSSNPSTYHLGLRPISLVICPATLTRHWLAEIHKFLLPEAVAPGAGHLQPVLYPEDRKSKRDCGM
ncbi:unnamed protein product [Protopolystoma xenopodis]|uniref:SNF2 N-terminal domain-containing protein n=1 Tax=Protopolystoma xenopodis TaxID=117903 RepID=A0A3S5A1G9_9PLAT|nr:unnamed protein product [Protopolystoma xenopodis]